MVAEPGVASSVVEMSRQCTVLGTRTDVSTRLDVIRPYKLDERCFVGRPDPPMEYFLSGGAAPSGAMDGEDCIPLDRDMIEVTHRGGGWKITDGAFLLAGNEMIKLAESTPSTIRSAGPAQMYVRQNAVRPTVSIQSRSEAIRPAYLMKGRAAHRLGNAGFVPAITVGNKPGSR